MKENGKDVVKEEGRQMKNKRQDGRFTVTVTGLKVLLKGGYCPDELIKKKKQPPENRWENTRDGKWPSWR